MNYEMSLFAKPFEKVKSGQQTIEVRLYDEKRRKVNIGDTITFAKLPEREESVTVDVVGLSRFGSFSDLFSSLDKCRIGHPDEYTIEDQINGMREVYPEEREKELGVLGIHIRRQST